MGFVIHYHRKDVMELRENIIEKIKESACLPLLRFNDRVKSVTQGHYKKWLDGAKRLIDLGELVATNEEMLLLDFYEAVEIVPLQKWLEMATKFEEMVKSDPEAKKAWMEMSKVIELRRQKHTELTQKFNKVRPQIN